MQLSNLDKLPYDCVHEICRYLDASALLKLNLISKDNILIQISKQDVFYKTVYALAKIHHPNTLESVNSNFQDSIRRSYENFNKKYKEYKDGFVSMFDDNLLINKSDFLKYGKKISQKTWDIFKRDEDFYNCFFMVFGEDNCGIHAFHHALVRQWANWRLGREQPTTFSSPETIGNYRTYLLDHNLKDIKIEMFFERIHRLFPIFNRNSSYFVCASSVEKNTFTKLKEQFKYYEKKRFYKKPILLLGFKRDLRKKQKCIPLEKIINFCIENDLLYIELSAKEGMCKEYHKNVELRELFLRIFTNLLIKEKLPEPLPEHWKTSQNV